MYISRWLDLRDFLRQRSLFLFGPRQTGKSSLIRHSLSDCRVYNLLDSQVYLDLSRSPGRIAQELKPTDRIVVIDEIQKLPNLLDEVHRLIEEREVRFLLTGSSARKLRRGGVNLLGGRARSRTLHPFICMELADSFDLSKALNRGLLPSIYLSDAPEEDLKSYAGIYLQEEVAAEGLTRNIPAFSRFLQVAALCNGKLINYTKISNDAQVARSTVQEYFEILKDTLIAFELPSWKTSIRRKPIGTSKLFFFDCGIARFLQNRRLILEGSPEFGEAFEAWLFHELRSYVDYRGAGSLHHWRSTSGFEVDFILDESIAIEAKAKRTVGPHDLKGLHALGDESNLRRYVVVCLEERSRTVGNLEIVGWREFLGRLWAGEYSAG